MKRDASKYYFMNEKQEMRILEPPYQAGNHNLYCQMKIKFCVKFKSIRKLYKIYKGQCLTVLIFTT